MIKPLATLAAALALTACTDRFVADFEADPINLLPQANPAGDPSDTIISDENDGDIRVSNANPVAGNKSLRLTGNTNLRTGPRVLMFAEPLAASNKSITASWQGRVSGTPQVEITFAALGSTGAVIHEYVTVRLDDGVVGIFDDTENEFLETIGLYTPNQNHSFLIRVSPGAQKYFVESTGATTPGTDFEGNISADATPLATQVGLILSLKEAGGSDIYKMDTVRIKESSVFN